MLGDNYLKFENVALPNPKSFSIAYENKENLKDSETGTTIGTVTRLQKRTFNCSFDVSSRWAATIRSLCNLSQGSLVYKGETITCRARLTNDTLAQYSEYAERTDGLWTITVAFSEL